MDSSFDQTAETCITKAAALAPGFASRAAEHDTNDSFAAANFAELKACGLTAAAAPRELGGGGASVPELAEMLRQMAHSCSATALAFAMHTHQVAIPAWRWHHRPDTRAMTEPLLKRVVAEKILIVTSGGSDWIGGSGKAEKVEGGYKITARKIFASGSPAGDILTTGAVLDEDGNRSVLHFALPMNAPGVKVTDSWHAMGMRATGSHDIEIDGAFVPDDKVALKRKAGEWHFLFQITTNIAFPLIYSVYLGIAERARDLALTLAQRKPLCQRTLRIAGEMDTALAAARYAQRAMIETAEANSPGAESVNQTMMGRRIVEEQVLRSLDLAMELAGGIGFYRTAGLERLFRDIQGARYHAMQREAQYEYAGALAFGQPVATIY